MISAVLAAAPRSVAENFEQLADIRDRFQREYRAMLKTLLRKGLPAAVRTITTRATPTRRSAVCTAALCMINDCIIREAAITGLPIIDLRAACGENADFSNPIEPSVQGGSKIAAAITSAVTQPDFGLSRCVIFTR